MALAYTAPTWTDGSGEGISAANLQAISNCLEGLVQGTDKAVHSIAINGSTITFTFADGTQETATAVDLKSVVSIEKTATVGSVDTYTITYSDGTTSTFFVTNGRDGAIQYTAGTGISISEENVISATGGGGGSTVTVDHDGTASDTGVRKQRIGIDGVYYDVDGSAYMEKTANSASFVFTNSTHITSDTVVDGPYTDTWGDNPSNVVTDGSAHTVTVTFSAAQTRTVRIYIK